MDRTEDFKIINWQKVVACCFLSILVLLSGCASGKHAASSPFVLRILTYNIHHGEGADGKLDIERIAKVILDSKADLVALQEVDRGGERSKKIDIMTTLSDLTGMTYAFGKNIDYGGGDYGNGALTRYPILAERNLHYQMIRAGEQRGLLQLVVEVKGQEIVFMNTHIDYRADESERVTNVNEIKKAAESYSSSPVILCGDFNDSPESKTIASLKNDFSDAWDIAGSGDGYTYSTSDPKKRIDYVFMNKNKSDTTSSILLRPVSARVLSTNASDHLPLLVEFELKPGN